jgi:hypothetical protein
MRRALAILAAFGLGWIAPVASAQPAWLAGGPYLEPETGAAILFGACPKGIGTDRLCGTVAGWHDDTPLPGPVAGKACGSVVLVETEFSDAAPALVAEARGVLAKAGIVRLTPGPLGTLVAMLGLDEIYMERRTPLPMTRSWVPARWGWTPCDASPTS